MAHGEGVLLEIFRKYTDLWVETLRRVLPDTKYMVPHWVAVILDWPNSATTEGKDLAYILGHVAIYIQIVALVGLVVWWLWPLVF